MERLTMRDDKGVAFWKNEKCPGGGYRMTDDKKDQERLDRLAAYEDTGLEPKEVKEFLEDVESRFILWVNKRYGIPAMKLVDIMEAEKDGRLVVLPCKVGDTIYWADIYMGRKDVEEYQVEKIDPTIIFKGHTYIPASRIGKNYFLTREEAEAALKKRGADNAAD